MKVILRFVKYMANILKGVNPTLNYHPSRRINVDIGFMTDGNIRNWDLGKYKGDYLNGSNLFRKKLFPVKHL